MRIALAALLLLIQAAPRQSEADKLEAALKNFGDRTYRITEGGKEAGTLTLKTRIEKEGDRNVAVFEDQFSAKIGGLDAVMTFTETASLNGLRMVSAHRAGTAPDGKFESKATLKNGKAVLKDNDEESTFDIGPDTVGELAVLRLVCAAEQKKDATFKADMLSLMMPGYEPGHAFKCVGQEQVEIGGRKLDAFKWEEKGEWMHTFSIQGTDRTLTSKANNTYWVSPDGYLLRFTAGRSEMTLDAK